MKFGRLNSGKRQYFGPHYESTKSIHKGCAVKKASIKIAPVARIFLVRPTKSNIDFRNNINSNNNNNSSSNNNNWYSNSSFEFKSGEEKMVWRQKLQDWLMDLFSLDPKRNANCLRILLLTSMLLPTPTASFTLVTGCSDCCRGLGHCNLFYFPATECARCWLQQINN